MTLFDGLYHSAWYLNDYKKHSDHREEVCFQEEHLLLHPHHKVGVSHTVVVSRGDKLWFLELNSGKEDRYSM